MSNPFDKIKNAVDQLFENNIKNLVDGAELIEQVRDNFIFDTDFGEVSDTLPPMSASHYLIALSLLEQACHQMKISDYLRMRND